MLHKLRLPGAASTYRDLKDGPHSFSVCQRLSSPAATTHVHQPATVSHEMPRHTHGRRAGPTYVLPPPTPIMCNRRDGMGLDGTGCRGGSTWEPLPSWPESSAAGRLDAWKV